MCFKIINKLFGAGVVIINNSAIVWTKFRVHFLKELSQQFRGSAVSLHAFSFFTGQSLGPIAFGLGAATIGLGASLGAAAVLLAALSWSLARRPA